MSKKTHRKCDELQLMGHIVAGYPNIESSFNAALGICTAGASFLEIQFPFSDPNADGIAIESACNEALAQGFKVEMGFSLLSKLYNTLSQTANPTKLIIVTYANLIFTYGIESFLKKAKECGVWGIIVPDLPMESDESISVLAKRYHIALILLITPMTPKKRMKHIAKKSNKIVYVVARAGITGDSTQFNSAFFAYLHKVHKCCKKPIALGFGISSYTQVATLKGKVDIVVAGSYFVRFIATLAGQNLAPEAYFERLQAHTRTLMGWDLP